MTHGSDLIRVDNLGKKSTPEKLSYYPTRLSLVTSRRDQLALERRDPKEFDKPTNKMLTAHLRTGFLPQWRTDEEDACQLLLNNVIFCSNDLVAFNKPPGKFEHGNIYEIRFLIDPERSLKQLLYTCVTFACKNFAR